MTTKNGHEPDCIAFVEHLRMMVSRIEANESENETGNSGNNQKPF